MKKNVKDAILLSFYQSKSAYQKLAHEIGRLFETDPSFPTESLYTIKYRVKNENRLIEKIDERNKKRRKSIISSINAKNYQKRIEDLLGIRIVCLRLSDVEKIEKYLNSLRDEAKLSFICKPQKKQTFVLPVNPGEELPRGVDLQYSGYSSIHYVVKLGRNFNPPREIASLCAEIQLRTILEEAWGEIDHKYRYEIIRKGAKVPENVQRGFYNLSAYLQAAALQAEYLCRDAEKIKMPRRRRSRRLIHIVAPRGKQVVPSTMEEVIKAKFGFSPTPRTIGYIERRMWDANIFQNAPQTLHEQILTEEVINTFTEIYAEVMQKNPFTDKSERDIDLLNAVNYALFRLIQPEDVAKEGLLSVLNGRRKRIPI